MVETELLGTDPVISDSIVRPVVASYFVTQVATTHLLFALCLIVCKRGSVERSVKSVPQIFKSFRFIRSLVARVLTLRHDASGYMHSSAG